jgi:hypothetical protein
MVMNLRIPKREEISLTFGQLQSTQGRILHEICLSLYVSFSGSVGQPFILLGTVEKKPMQLKCESFCGYDTMTFTPFQMAEEEEEEEEEENVCRFHGDPTCVCVCARAQMKGRCL